MSDIEQEPEDLVGGQVGAVGEDRLGVREPDEPEADEVRDHRALSALCEPAIDPVLQGHSALLLGGGTDVAHDVAVAQGLAPGEEEAQARGVGQHGQRQAL